MMYFSAKETHLLGQLQSVLFLARAEVLLLLYGKERKLADKYERIAILPGSFLPAQLRVPVDPGTDGILLLSHSI